MKVSAVYFSPTGSTEKMVDLVANTFGPCEKIDLSKREADFCRSFAQEDLCVIGVPSYGGRVPAAALERMQNFQGNQAKAVLLVSYGNRAYDDTLKELADFVESKGFCCVAAIAAVAEHSIMHQFATGRPDQDDQKELVQFAQNILNKLRSNAPLEKPALPGNVPYREYKGVPLKPKASGKCTSCGLCASVCPVGAISAENPKKLDADACISCMRCIQVCPSHARKVNPLLVKVAAKKMQAACEQRKPNELFL